MKQRLIIGIVVVLILTFIGFKILTCCPTGELDCISEGQMSFDESTGKSFGECCEGLKKIGDVFYDEEKTCEEIFMMVGYGSICSDSGNGNCEEWENKCNCTEDCD